MDDKTNPKAEILSQVRENLHKVIELLAELDNANKENEQFKVIHFKENPMELAVRARRDEFHRLKRQNEKLKLRMALLEAGDESDLTRTIYEGCDKRARIELMSRKVEELKQREEKLLSSYSRMGREFREVFYLLTGLRINAIGEGVYEVLNMYAENEDDKLLMKIARDGSTHLLQNDYSDKLTDYIETYLEKQDSFPAFLAALTLNLFKSDDIDLSVDMMETTVVPRNF